MNFLPRSSMDLIREITEGATEPAYASVKPGSKRGFIRPITLLVLSMLIGFGLTIAAGSLTVPKAEADNPRKLLVDRIEVAQIQAKNLRESNAKILLEAQRLEASAAGEDPANIASDNVRIELGTLPVSGPAYILTFKDSLRDTDAKKRGRVRDTDLQMAINQLWASGAQAIEVNGKRLTATSAVRAAGDAILVDLEPILSPYRVVAIGPVEAMSASYEKSPIHRQMLAVRDSFGMGYEGSKTNSVVFKGKSNLSVKFAKPGKG